MVALVGSCGLLTRQTGLGQGRSSDSLPLLQRCNTKCSRLSRKPRDSSISAVMGNPEPSRSQSPLPTLALRLAAGAALVLPLAGSLLGVMPRAAYADSLPQPLPASSMPAESVIDERTGLAKPWLYRSGMWSQEQYRWVHKFYTSARVPRAAPQDVTLAGVAATADAQQQQSPRQQAAGLTWHPGSMSVNLPNPMDMTDPNNPLATPTGRVVASAALAAMVLLLLRMAMPRQRTAQEGVSNSRDDDDDDVDIDAGSNGMAPPKEELTDEQCKALVQDAQRRIEQAKRAMAFAQQAQQDQALDVKGLGRQEEEEEAAKGAEQEAAARAQEEEAEAKRIEQEAAAHAQHVEEDAKRAEQKAAARAQREEENAKRAEQGAAARAQREEEDAKRAEQEALLRAQALQQQEETLRAQQAEQQRAELLRAQQEEMQRVLEAEQAEEAQRAQQQQQQGEEETQGAAPEPPAPTPSLAAAGAAEVADLPPGVSAMLAAGTIRVEGAGAAVAPATHLGLTTDFMGMMAAGTISAAEVASAEDAVLPAADGIMEEKGTLSSSAPPSPEPIPEPLAARESTPAPPDTSTAPAPYTSYVTTSAKPGALPVVTYRFSEGGVTAAAMASAASAPAAPRRVEGASGSRKPGAASLGGYLAGRGSEGPAYAALGLLSAAAGVFAPLFQGTSGSKRSAGQHGGKAGEWDAMSLLLAPAAPLMAALPEQAPSAKAAGVAGGKKYDMLLTMLQDALQQPEAQGNERYDPVRSLLRMAPLRGQQRYDFAASLLRGMVEEDSARSADAAQAGQRFDMVWDLVHGMRVEAEARGGGVEASKYDPLWELLEEAKLEQEWGAAPLDPLSGLSQWGPASDWDTPAPYDPLPDLFAALQAAPKSSKYDPMSSLLSTLSFLAAGPSGGKSKYDMLAGVLAAMGEHESDARSARADSATPAKLDAWGWLVQRALSSEGGSRSAPAGKYDPLTGATLRAPARGGADGWDFLPGLLRAEAPVGVSKYDMLPALWRVQAPTVISKYDLAQDVLEGSWVSLVGADPMEVASGAVGGLMHSMQSRAAAAQRGSRAGSGSAEGGGAGLGSPAVAMDRME